MENPKNIEQKLIELSKELHRLQSLMLKEKTDFQPPQGDYSLLFSASQNSLKSKASENSYLNQSSEMHDINDLLLTVDQVCNNNSKSEEFINAQKDCKVKEETHECAEESTQDDFDELLLLVNDAINEPFNSSAIFDHPSSRHEFDGYSSIRSSTSEYEPIRVEDLAPSIPVDYSHLRQKTLLEPVRNYQRYPKVEYESMIEDDTIMEVCICLT